VSVPAGTGWVRALGSGPDPDDSTSHTATPQAMTTAPRSPHLANPPPATRPVTGGSEGGGAGTGRAGGGTSEDSAGGGAGEPACTATPHT
jgi:hypothetical protein